MLPFTTNKAIKYFLILFFLELFGCKSGDFFTNSKNYNLNGHIKFVSEKTVPVNCDSNIINSLDSSLFGNVSYRNLFFDKKGRILKIERFNDDSCISSKDDFIYSIFGKLKVLNLYEEGKLKWKVKTLKHSKTFLETETVDVETGMLKTIYEIEYINGLQIKQTIRESNTTLINKCKRDKTGNEIEMSREINGEVIIEISKYKYFEFDNKGNWIKRIYFIPDDTDCNLIIRKLDYY